MTFAVWRGYVGTMLPACRSCELGVNMAPFVPQDAFVEEPTRAFLVRQIQRTATVPEITARILGAPHDSAIASHYRSFMHQALEYGRGAASLRGSSAGLLLYYSALNLAKCELSRTQHDLVGVHHGLRYPVKRSTSVMEDEVIVTADGVFPQLYEQRTGRRLPANTAVPVMSLLRRIPEIGWELDQLQVPRFDYSPLNFAVNFCPEGAFTVVAIHNMGTIAAPQILPERWSERFEEVSRPPRAQDMFSISPRGLKTVDLRYFQGPVAPYMPGWRGDGTDDLMPYISHEVSEFQACLGPYLERSHSDDWDATLGASLNLSEDLPLPASLARYMLMFYVSSLVRYNPVLVAPSEHPADAWLIDSWVDQAAVPMLIDAHQGITGVVGLYGRRLRR